MVQTPTQLKETVVVAGSLAQKPDYPGHAWFFLQYVLGFRRLGFDVLFLDWLSSDLCDGPGISSQQVRHLVSVMAEFDLSDSFGLILRPNGETIGLSRREILRRVRSSALLLNVMGYLDDDEILAAAPLRVFLDIDPGFPQMWRELGLADTLRGHDVHVTIGENIGKPGCAIPTCGLDWLTTPQPIVLTYWPPQQPHCHGSFTTVAAWRGPYGPLEYAGRTYGLRVHEYRKFARLPSLCAHSFEVALDIDPADRRDRQLLTDNGWLVLDPLAVAPDLDGYRRYVQRSRAEFMVAKNMYVRSQSGWFSDRSICYLASGRPVLAQDTGLADVYPLGEGLLVFETLDEARAGVEEIVGNYARHSRAAVALAHDCFDSDKVLRRLLTRLAVY